MRRDITKSFGDASGVAEGVPATLELTLLDVAGGGEPLAGAAVYVWHCDTGRTRSTTAPIAGENYLRGVQESDAEGKLTFNTIFPAAYSGRWPHIHFEVYQSLARRQPAARSRARRSSRCPRTSASGSSRRPATAERGEPRADVARRRHGLQRRLREPARQGVRHAEHGITPSAQRRGLSREELAAGAAHCARPGRRVLERLGLRDVRVVAQYHSVERGLTPAAAAVTAWR